MQAPFADPLSGLERLRPTLPMVGRDRELAVIHTLLDTVQHDWPVGARALTISGEMGIGKTRVLAALCQEARERDFLVLSASAYESYTLFPYFPFIEALRPLLSSLAPERLRRLTGLATAPVEDGDGPENGADPLALTGISLVEALVRLFPGVAARLGLTQEALQEREILTPEQEKFRLLDAIATLLEHLACERPILLSIDNVQWADSASMELLLYLTVRLHSSRVALVGATRPPGSRQEQSNEAALSQATASKAIKALGELVRQGMLVLLPLGPLTDEVAMQHLQNLLPDTVPQELLQSLQARAEGNPFFLEELVRTLHPERRGQDDEWREQLANRMRLPESIVLAVSQRLEGVSRACRDLLHAAALLGRSFPLEALLLSLPQEPDEVQTLIDEAAQALVIARVPASEWDDAANHTRPTFFATQGQVYLFCHGIVQEILHAEVPAHQARLLHSAIGQALETYYAYAATEHAAELAHHYLLGGEKKATLRWSLAAGEAAANQQAHREAINHFRLALKLLEAGESFSQEQAGAGPATSLPSLSELALIVGELWFRLGELEQAATMFQQALQRLRHEDGEALLVARANRLLADIYRMQTRYDQAVAHLQVAHQAFDALTELDESKTPVSNAVWFPGRSFTLARSLQPQMSTIERIHCLQSEAMLNILLNRPQEAEEALWQAHQLAIAVGDRGSQAFALHMIGWLYGWGARIREALRLLEQAHDLYVAIGDPFHAALGNQGLSSIYQALGEMEQARLYTLRGIERARRYGVRRIAGLLYWNQGSMALAQGDWEGCESHLQQALQEALTNNDSRLKAMTIQAQAELHFRRGNWAEAEQLFLDGMQAATATEWFSGMVALYGHFLAVTGRQAEARRQLDRASALPEPPGFTGQFYIPFLAEGYLHLNASEQARVYSERIRKLRGFMYYGNAVDRILGVVAIQAGDWETADSTFEAALALCRRVNNQPEEAVILYEQARAVLMRRGPFGRLQALCQEARALFARYQMQRAVEMVDALLQGAEQLDEQKHSQGQKTAAAPVALHAATASSEYVLDVRLTRRELEVLRLVAEGHTDREVAEMLVISPRTANRHLSNIFVKLDVPGRAAAVAYAIRQGMV
ncbi:MAG TPA: tetratricopeptide repeat protein [Ktedonobacteraceae bacterium]|nr:tetratricopeptide repeat protein [Ktedonobacteraceae bacterium]